MADINLEKAVSNILKDYATDISNITAEVVPEVAKEATKRLRQSAPRKTGKYAKGWKNEIQKSRLTVSATVYGNKDTCPLAHLLENGHANRGGGRTPGIVHIKPVEEWAVSELEKRITEKVGQQ